jgi:hypothetical protein
VTVAPRRHEPLAKEYLAASPDLEGGASCMSPFTSRTAPRLELERA